MNARKWLDANKGKRVEVVCRRMRDCQIIENHFDKLGEVIELGHGWIVNLTPSNKEYWFEGDNLGALVDGQAIFASIIDRIVVRYEFTLLE